jgi:hypothetical protein
MTCHTGTVAKKKPRPVIVHSLDHARLALAAAREEGAAIVLRSAEDAASYAGAGWFAAMIAAAKREFPDVEVTASLDCGTSPGYALAALREGIKLLRLRGAKRVRTKVSSIARKSGAALDDDPTPALDLLYVAEPRSALRDWLR